MSSTSGIRTLAVLAALAMLAGCGSTVRVTDEQAAGGASASTDEFGAVAEQTGGVSSGAATVGGGANQLASAGRSAATARSAGTASAASNAGSALFAPGTSGRGYTAKEIYVGYLTWKDVSNVGGTLGYAVDYGDEEAQPRAVVKDINDHGGIAGRKVVIVFYDYESGDIASNPSAGDQKACTKFTEDRPVFAVVAVTGILTDSFPECLAKHQTVLIANTNVAYPQEQFNRLAPYFYANASPTIERYVPAWLQRAAAVGYFGGWDNLQGVAANAPAKIGVLGDTSPIGQRITKIIIDELKRQGRTPTTTFEVGSALDANGMSSAVLRFKADGVTHVISGVLQLLIFPQTAEAQHYRPRYAVSSFHAPILLQAAVPREQLAGALGAGYYETSDVDTPHDPGDASPFEAHCRKIEQEAGQDTSQREAYNFMVKACDGFALLREAVTRGGLSVEGVRRGVAAISTMPPAGTFVISFGGGALSGVAAVRDLAYNTDCRCFVYLSTTNHGM